MALLVGRRTCNLQVAGSSPGWAVGTIAYWPWASYLHLYASVTKQYNLVPAKRGDFFGWEGNHVPAGK